MFDGMTNDEMLADMFAAMCDYEDDIKDIKSELYDDDYATAMMRELGITSDEALFGEM